MSVTYGFYNSKDSDRRYDAIQMSSIFDGIIEDGILQHYGTAMVVKESSGMTVNVGAGRAWFNHTWTLNDAVLPVTIPASETILNRYDAVVLEVNASEDVRANQITVVKGTAAVSPSKPTMISTTERWQYPLAYIYVGAGVTSIRQSNITNCVGTSACPYVTAPLEKMSIDDLVAQWADQWDEFYENETADMEATNAYWKKEWSTWFNAQTAEIQAAYLAWEDQWTSWYESQTADMEETQEFWEQQWSSWFMEYVNNNSTAMSNWQNTTKESFDEWFASLQAVLDDDVAANLTNLILDLQKRTAELEQFKSDIVNDQVVYQVLYDNGYRNYDDLLDSDGDTILDSDSEAIIGRTYDSEPILDSDGNPIIARILFEIK